MRHCALCHFNKHRKDSFLKREAHVGGRVGARPAFALAFAPPHVLNRRQQATERHIHAFHHIRQWCQFASLFCFLLNVVAWRRIVRKAQNARKPIQTIANLRIDATSVLCLMCDTQQLCAYKRLVSPRYQSFRQKYDSAAAHTKSLECFRRSRRARQGSLRLSSIVR